MDTDDLVATLQEAGLSPYEADAYVALLELGTASASEVADRSEVPQPRVYDVLESLEDREYVETYKQGSLKARAHSPAEVLDDLRSRAGAFERAADEVEDRWEQPELESNRASIVKRFRTVLGRAETFIDGAQHQIQLAVDVENFERLRPRLRAARDRGVVVKVSIQTEQGETPPPTDAFEGVCAETRHRDLPGPFVLLVDREKTCFSHHNSYDQYGVLVDDRTHTYVFHWYFLTCLWEPWPTVYNARNDDYPVEYVDIRQFVRDVQPVLDAGGMIRADVRGYDTETGEATTVEGTIDRVVYGGAPSADDTARRLAGQVTAVVDTDGGERTVGGWGAMLEDVEATRIVVTEVLGDDGTVRQPADWAAAER